MSEPRLDPIIIRWWFVIALVLALAVAMGFIAGSSPGVAIGIICSAIVAYMLLLAGNRWWLVIIIALFFGGVFNAVGGQLNMLDVGLAVALVALTPSWALRRKDLFQHRESFPEIIRILAIYIIVHGVANFASNRFTDVSGQITALRYHWYALWPIFFGYLFNLYGSSKCISTAIHLIAGVSALRALLGFINYFTGITYLIPVIGYSPPGIGWTDSYDLRYSCPALALMLSCYFAWSKSNIVRFCCCAIYIVAFYGVILSGGRAGLVLFLIVPFWWAVIHRKWLQLIGFTLCAFLSLFVLSTNNAIVTQLPTDARRALSVIIDKTVQADNEADLTTSDYWHRRLRSIAIERWTQSWHSLAFGTGIFRYPNDGDWVLETSGDNFENHMQVSARSGAYESGILNVLSVLGACGFLIYAALLWWLFSRLIRLLWNDGVCDAAHAFAYIAAFNILVWSTLSWTFGNLPSLELFLGIVAVIGLQDQKRTKVPDSQIASDIKTYPRALPRRRVYTS